MANSEIQAVLKIVSKLDLRELQRLQQELNKVQKQTDAFNKAQETSAKKTSTLGKVQETANRTSSALMARAGGVLAPAAAGYTVKRAITNFADFERQMTRIGITADATDTQVAAATDRLQELSKDYALPLEESVHALDTIVAAGASMDEAMRLLPSVLATAQASGTAAADIADAALKTSRKLLIVPEQMQLAFDHMVESGKSGQAELNEMAAELPELLNLYGVAGYRGVEGLDHLLATMQTLREGTAATSTAATQLRDIMIKMNTQETINKFDEFGVDLVGKMNEAEANGEDRLAAFVRITRETIAGDNDNLPLLFADKELLLGMTTLLDGWETRWQHFLDVVKDSKVEGAVFRDLSKVINDSAADLQNLSSAWDKFMKSIGGAVVATGAVEGLTTLSGGIDYMNAVDAGLEKKGVTGFWDKLLWFGTPEEQRRMARAGGYTPDGAARVAKNYAPKAYEVLGRTPQRPASQGRSGAAAIAEQYALYGARATAPAPEPDFWDKFLYGSMADGKTSFREGMKVKTGISGSDAGAPEESAAEFERRITAALSSGGEKAGSSIEEAGTRAGENAGSAFGQRMNDAARAFGEAAASSFNSNVRTPRAFPGNTGQSVTSPDDL